MASTQIPKTMEAAVLKDYKTGFVYVNDRPVPDVGENDVLVKVRAAGYCHTDKQVSQGEFCALYALSI